MPRIDFEFEPLKQRLADLDRQLAALADRVDEVDDPDAFGVFDDVERVVGDGFLAIQLYMTSRRESRDAGSAYACGPKHRAIHIARILNAAANYRKHRDEWPFDESKHTDRAKSTTKLITDAGVVEPDYRLYHLLGELVAPAPPRLSALVPHLASWRTALDPGTFMDVGTWITSADRSS